jgi:hypothetical protein
MSRRIVVSALAGAALTGCHSGLLSTLSSAEHCSEQFAVRREDFQGTVGVRGTISGNGHSLTGWTLVDTGGSYLRVRSPRDDGSPDASQKDAFTLSFGPWKATSHGAFSSALFGFYGPSDDGRSTVKGTQIGTIGSALLSQWAVRIAPTEVLFSDDGSACSVARLQAEGFHRMDSTGYFQRSGAQADVKPAVPLDLVIPTVPARILGHEVVVQIDTGYEAPADDLQIEVNHAFAQQLKLPAKPGKTLVINGVDVPWYRVPGWTIEFIDADSKQSFASVRDISIVVKDRQGGGIASWGVPAALISSRVFARAFAETELRADLKSVWAKALK